MGSRARRNRAPQSAVALRWASTELSPHCNRLTKSQSGGMAVEYLFGLLNIKVSKDFATYSWVKVKGSACRKGW